MAVLDQIFLWSVVFSLIIEITLVVIGIVSKKKIINEDSRKVLEDNKLLVLISIGLMLVAILFELLGEIVELIATEYPAIDFIERFHMTVLLSSLIIIGILTYKMVRVK
jgi:uncharacterized membrane protein